VILFVLGLKEVSFCGGGVEVYMVQIVILYTEYKYHKNIL
jgi:hypothetical protein